MENGLVGQILVWVFCKHEFIMFVESVEEHPLQDMAEMEQALHGDEDSGGSGGGKGL